MNTNVDTLTESIVENGSTILAATLIVKGPADRPHRVVLRYWRGEYVTHLECLQETKVCFKGRDLSPDEWSAYEHASYDQGHYHGTDLEAAMRDFHERSAVFLRRLARKA